MNTTVKVRRFVNKAVDVKWSVNITERVKKSVNGVADVKWVVNTAEDVGRSVKWSVQEWNYVQLKLKSNI